MQVCVRINFRRLQQNMSKEHGRPVSLREIHRWLRDAGFRPTRKGWVGEEKDLGHLKPSEVTLVERLD
jgi:hypothetical protein